MKRATQPAPEPALPQPRLPRETADQRLERQAGYFRELAEINMQTARIAGAKVERAALADEDIHKHTLDLSRATTAVKNSVHAENDLHRKHVPPRAPASDRRRAPLRDALYQAASPEPTPAARNERRREIETAVEAVLVADPDAETNISDHLFRLADRLAITLNPAILSDELIGMAPRVYIRDG